MDVRRDCVNFAQRHSACVLALPQLSSGGAGAGIVLPGHGTSTSL
jgi:hypothetical protein